MDFASLMAKEISKSKTPTPSAADREEDTKKKYLRRAEVEAEREAAYRESQRKLQAEKDERAAKKRKLDDELFDRNLAREEKKRKLAEESKIKRDIEEKAIERARRKRLGLPELPDEIEGTPLAEGEEDIPSDELTAKLRALSEPATLFGETHRQRLRRYQRLTAPSSKVVLSSGPIPTSLLPVPEAELKVPKAVPKDDEAKTFLYRQLASYFTLLLTEWQRGLAARPASVKESFQGKAAYNAMAQALENMRPLFKHFEKGDLEEGILAPVVEIVHAAQERRYVDANDGYLRVSIGNAAWPIGVTMVGIHERSAREKLHESGKSGKGQAHIMSDEATRKFLQSIKRCLSFAQTRWPPEDQLQLMG
jgi:pre-mRNA-splicing factor 18